MGNILIALASLAFTTVGIYLGNLLPTKRAQDWMSKGLEVQKFREQGVHQNEKYLRDLENKCYEKADYYLKAKDNRPAVLMALFFAFTAIYFLTYFLEDRGWDKDLVNILYIESFALMALTYLFMIVYAIALYRERKAKKRSVRGGK